MRYEVCVDAKVSISNLDTDTKVSHQFLPINCQGIA